jgi:hypothetical protein
VKKVTDGVRYTRASVDTESREKDAQSECQVSEKGSGRWQVLNERERERERERRE